MPFTLIAHRGGRADSPENTRAAFDTSLLKGFHHFETDVQLTADNVCIIFHDDVLDRTTSGTGPVDQVRTEQKLLDDSRQLENLHVVELSFDFTRALH